MEYQEVCPAPLFITFPSHQEPLLVLCSRLQIVPHCRKLIKMEDQVYQEALEESPAFQNPGNTNLLSDMFDLNTGSLSFMRGLHGCVQVTAHADRVLITTYAVIAGCFMRLCGRTEKHSRLSELHCPLLVTSHSWQVKLSRCQEGIRY